jgi:hypothetical protein
MVLHGARSAYGGSAFATALSRTLNKGHVVSTSTTVEKRLTELLCNREPRRAKLVLILEIGLMVEHRLHSDPPRGLAR